MNNSIEFKFNRLQFCLFMNNVNNYDMMILNKIIYRLSLIVSES